MTYSQAASSSSSIRRSYGRNQNTTAFASSRSRLGPISHLIILVVIISMMGLIYLTQVTKTYSLGYRVDELTKRQSTLSEEHANLELESVKLQSQTRIKDSTVAAGLESVTPSSYAQ
ncbi:MAG: cell division protein FtsL [Patescibacteria group bacterium]